MDSVLLLIALGYIISGMIVVIISKVWLEMTDDECLLLFFTWPFLLVTLIIFIPYGIAWLIAEIIIIQKKGE